MVYFNKDLVVDSVVRVDSLSAVIFLADWFFIICVVFFMDCLEDDEVCLDSTDFSEVKLFVSSFGWVVFKLVN